MGNDRGSHILHNATSRSLLIWDELGREPALTMAFPSPGNDREYPKPSRPESHHLFATHYHELTELADLLPGVRNYNVAVSKRMERCLPPQIVPGGADAPMGSLSPRSPDYPSGHPTSKRNLHQLEDSSGPLWNKNHRPQQLTPSRKQPLLKAFKGLDINSLTPIEALNLLYDWKRRFIQED